jgi:hypothetical protein
MSPIVIRADFDEEAEVWVAQSDEIPLVTEAATYELLLKKLPNLIQDVLEENGDSRTGTEVPFELVTQSRAGPRVDAA